MYCKFYLQYMSKSDNIDEATVFAHHVGVKIVRNNFQVLLARKAQHEHRRIPLSEVARATGLSRYTLTALADNSIKEYPADTLARLCEYLGCDISDLLILEDVPE
jgi:putative transcriptional regulator